MVCLPVTIPELDRIANALERLVGKGIKSKGTVLFQFSPTFSVGLTGGSTMFVLPDDQPDVRFSISPIELFDAEGAPITTGFTEEFMSDNDGVVSILLDDPANVHAGAIHIGAPGIANLNYTVTYNGAIVFSAGAQFTITTGQFGSVIGGELTFDGIAEQ